MPQKRIPTITRFLSKVQRPDDPEMCWLWTGAKDQDGYGVFWDGTYRAPGVGHYVRVTRWAHQQFMGSIPQGHQLLHRCDNPGCVNPAHLFTGTEKDNHQDREAKGRGRRMHGTDHVGAKLTDAAVREIKRRRASGETQVALAVEFGVSTALVSKLVNGKVWAHIE